MQFSVVALSALAAVATAQSGIKSNVTYVTQVVDVYTTVCPAATSFSFNGVTYTATASQTITITNCPCTISSAVTTIPAVSSAVVPVYKNTTVPAVATVPATTAKTTVVGTTSAKATSTPTGLAISGAEKAFAVSGVSLAGLLGFVAYIL